ncbi:MAG: hypothetical protein IAA47_02395 [Candidatus Fusobacterium pullicola]|uniref:Pili assembly chaperone N-terminal domain-containing protein n=2 Tax=Fusobacterium TaxID=848 RepID=A0A9E2KWT5_9FUSO|nr:hypothetical protein [uncultured Fusobacterium sp.]MBM6690427.1 hypothetical protein [Fusobacterium mortiferum]MBU3841831.1 hypothetical protein [Candidatus Fusobacterium pullicola]
MKRILVILVVVLCSTNLFALSFSIAPTEFDISLDKNQLHEAYIMNNTFSPLRIEIYKEDVKGYEDKSITEDIIIFPKIISIRPGGKQLVRFKVKPNPSREKGVYRSLLVFRESPNNVKTISKNENGNFETKLNFITEIAIGVKGEKK